MELEKLSKMRRLAFILIHAIFLMSVVGCLILAANIELFCLHSGIPVIREANPKGVEAVVILWIIGTTLALVAARKKIFAHDSGKDAYQWDQPIVPGGNFWFYLITVPQLLMSAYTDIYFYFFEAGQAVGLVMFAAKVICAVYSAVVLSRGRA